MAVHIVVTEQEAMPCHALHALHQSHLLIVGKEGVLSTKIRKLKSQDEAVIKAVKELKKSPTQHLRSEEWSEEQGLILFRGKVYIPKDIRLRLEIIKLHHDSLTAGHPPLLYKTNPIMSRSFSTFGFGRDFVRRSAGMSSVCIYIGSIVPRPTSSLNQ